MIEVVRYHKELRSIWNEYVSLNKKSVFLFHRDFMEYHSDRFSDHSLLFYKGSKLIALLPANQSESSLISHQGLTYGGLITGKIAASDLLNVIKVLIEYADNEGIKRLVYKVMPTVFQSSFQENDLYALFRNGFVLTRRDLSFVVDLQSEIKYSKDRRYRINKSKRNELQIKESSDFELFMNIVNENLKNKFNLKAVHSFEELSLLQSRFPENIKLLVVETKDKVILGGGLLFLDNDFIHTQYLHSNQKGKELNAIEYLIDSLIEHNTSKRFLSFGTSTEDNGRYLNEGLSSFKEGFGATGIVHDFYELQLND